MPVVVAKFLKRLRFFQKPVVKVWVLAGLGLASTLFAGWGLLRITSLSAEFESHDDKLLVAAITLKEEVAAYSKLTYDFLLQQDFSHMMQKEKQSNATRAGIEQGLAELNQIDEGDKARPLADSIRANVTQFLSLTDKALESATEDGSVQKARSALQDSVEPTFKTAEDSLNEIIYSRQKFDQSRYHHLRAQALMVIAFLIGLTTLGIALLIGIRNHVLLGHAHIPASAPQTEPASLDEDARDVEARSLAALAFANRLSRVRKESDDLKKLLSGLQSFIAGEESKAAEIQPGADADVLARQEEKITHAVGRIQHVHDQSKQFIDKLNDIMSGMQKLATDGNVVSLNVTIELAKLQSQQTGKVEEEKNAKISEQIRALATSAASITGKLAMVVSQFRYAQEDFSHQTTALTTLSREGGEALGRLRQTVQSNGQMATKLSGQRHELAGYLPKLEKKMAELEQQISQLQAIYAEEVETAGGEGLTPRSFKVISGRAA